MRVRVCLCGRICVYIGYVSRAMLILIYMIYDCLCIWKIVCLWMFMFVCVCVNRSIPNVTKLLHSKNDNVVSAALLCPALFNTVNKFRPKCDMCVCVCECKSTYIYIWVYVNKQKLINNKSDFNHIWMPNIFVTNIL